MSESTLPEVVFGLQLQGADGPWSVVRAHVTEGLSELYECALEVACPDDVDPVTLLGKRAVLSIAREGGERRVCGVVVGALDRGWVSRRRVGELTVAPALWLLGQNTDHRIFQEVHALAVVEMVLAEAGVYQGERLVKRVSDAPAVREYCTQYGESDLAFVRRLLEEEGLTFSFDHDGDEETLVITQGSQADVFPALETGGPVAVMGEGGATAARETVRALDRGREVVPTGVRLRDYDFTHPRSILDERREQPDALGSRVQFEYPARVTLGAYATGSKSYGESDARKLAPARLAEARLRDTYWLGRGNVTGLQPGRVIEVLREDATEVDKLLVVRVTHAGEAPEVLHLDDATGGRGSAGLDRYANQFECVAADTPYRPARRTAKPRALTPQSAVVVPEPKDSTDPIATDAHGRVKVCFQWDRPSERPARQAAKNASCWVRTQQAWAGNGWGFVFLPRVGMEVLVQFLDADPDRPVVTGCLYNGVNRTPEALPDKKSRSVLRTHDTPDGDGYNELAFEDLHGSELVYLRAQKDLSEKVFNDHLAEYDHDETVTVGNDQTLTVKHDRAATIENDDTLAVTNNRKATVGGNDTLEVDKNLSVTVFEASTLTVSKTHTVSIDEGLKVTVGGNAGTRLEMKPESIRLSYQTCKIEMTASGITLQVGGNKIEMTASAVKTTVGVSSIDVGMTAVTVESITSKLTGAGGSKLEAAPGSVTVSSPGTTTVLGSLVKIN